MLSFAQPLRVLTSQSINKLRSPLTSIAKQHSRLRITTSTSTMASAPRTALNETKDGAFVRTDAGFRNQIKPDGEFPPEAGRYHLYISYACPWACRCLSALYLKGLQDVISVSVTHPTWQRTRPDDPEDQHCGWMFASPEDPPVSSSTGHGSFGCQDCIPDTVNSTKFVRDLYELADPTAKKFSVPVLWDKQRRTIVNNESSEIMRMFNSEFNHLAQNPQLDLYPQELRAQIDEVNAWVYDTINNGVYKCGFATKQEPYEKAFRELFSSLDRVEAILSSQRYLVGDRLTEADVRLFQTLIRFDPVYVVYFKTNARFIRDYPAISGYVRELYALPGLQHATNIGHIKMHYFTSHPHLNTYAVIPLGGEPWWEQPHDRDQKLPLKQ